MAPGEEGKDRAGIAQAIREVEMVGPDIILVDGELDKTQPQRARIEVRRPLRVRADGGDMVDHEESIFGPLKRVPFTHRFMYCAVFVSIINRTVHVYRFL